MTSPVCVSVINMKGGVGKSTVAALLARYASIRLRKRVLAVDLDPQANLSQAFMTTSYEQFVANREPSIVEVFKGALPPAGTSGAPLPVNLSDVAVGPTPLGGPNAWLIPSRFDFSEHLVSALTPNPMVLAQRIAAEYADWDLILIDCAPTESILTLTAYHASRYVLVPVRPEYFATIGFPLLGRSLDDFRSKNPGHDIDVLGVVINNNTYSSGNDGGPEKGDSMRDIRAKARRNSWHVFPAQLPLSRGFPKMMRGNLSHLGDAPYAFDVFAAQFFERLAEHHPDFD